MTQINLKFHQAEAAKFLWQKNALSFQKRFNNSYDDDDDDDESDQEEEEDDDYGDDALDVEEVCSLLATTN